MIRLGHKQVSKSNELLDDDQLVLKAEAGETAAVGVLVNRYSGELYPYLLKMTGHKQTAEDIFQDTFVRILTKKGKYRGQGHFRAFIFTVARNLVYDMLRKRRVRKEISLDSITGDEDQSFELSVDETTPVDVLTKKERETIVNRAIDELPPKLKEAVILKRFCNYSYEDIAEMVGCSTSAIKMRVSRALSQLGKMISEYENERSQQT